MKINICGSRGIPNNYGGFEQCAERLAVLLVEAGHDVTVYNPDYHPYSEKTFQGVKIVQQWNPEKKVGTIGNFIYDYRCMQHAYKEEADIVLVLGYTTASVFFPFIRNKRSVLITNMDGLEWKRDKWNFLVKKIAKYLERLGAKYSDYLVADNREIQNYLDTEYHRAAKFIAYGAESFVQPDSTILKQYNLSQGNYDLLIARLEKENNIEMILDGVVASNSQLPFLVIGNNNTPYGLFLRKKYAAHSRILFIGGIYNFGHLNNLRYYSRFYFHGHSVGGTNPSLLEAMASSALILAHDNPFNRDVLGANAWYFASPQMVNSYLKDANNLLKMRSQFIQQNLMRIEQEYNWKVIAERYEKLFKEVVK